MTNSRRLAGLLGPTLMAIGATEAWNLDVFADQTAPVVYLNGTILFVAGLALVRAHSRWARDWTVLLTLTGWFLLLGGLYRMIAPEAPQAAPGIGSYALLAAIVATGALLTFQGRAPEREPHEDSSANRDRAGR